MLRSRLITAVALAGVLTATLTSVAAAPAFAASGLACRYTVIEWPGGFSADLVIVNNTTTTISGWTAAWNFQTPTQVTNTWNGSIVQGSPFDATGRSTAWNGVIRPGSSSALGWTANAAAADVPTEVIVNGARCPVN